MPAKLLSRNTKATEVHMAEYVLITGMSGAGRSTVANVFEDLGWFVIDNMPLPLVGKVAELLDVPGSTIDRVALVVGRNAPDELGAGGIPQALDQLRATGSRVRLVFLEAGDEVLIRRYEGTRRRHPLAEAEGPLIGVTRERHLLDHVRSIADVIIDSSSMNVHELRDRVIGVFGTARSDEGMAVSVVSFGFKHGLPTDVDLVFDLRFLPNPFWDEEMRPMTGLDAPVRDFVLGQASAQLFLTKVVDLLEMLLPAYAKEGKSYLSIAIGCTGGQHRSVAMAEEIGRAIGSSEYPIMVRHRDLHKR
jgi:RNase adapter protein RapZ